MRHKHRLKKVIIVRNYLNKEATLSLYYRFNS